MNTWTDMIPSQNKMRLALVAAGLPTDPSEWTAEQMEVAAELLQNVKP